MENKEAIKSIKEIFEPYSVEDIEAIYNKAYCQLKEIMFNYHESEKEDFTEEECKIANDCMNIIRLIELKKELQTKTK